MINIRINPELRALIDWGCSLREGINLAWITQAAIRHSRNKGVVIDENPELTTGNGRPVSFYDIPEDITSNEFRVILAAYLVHQHEKQRDFPYLTQEQIDEEIEQQKAELKRCQKIKQQKMEEIKYERM